MQKSAKQFTSAYVRSVQHKHSHKPQVFLTSSTWLCCGRWSHITQLENFIELVDVLWLGLKYCVQAQLSRHNSPATAEIRRVRMAFIFTKEFTAVGGNPVFLNGRLCNVHRNANKTICLKKNSELQQDLSQTSQEIQVTKSRMRLSRNCPARYFSEPPGRPISCTKLHGCAILLSKSWFYKRAAMLALQIRWNCCQFSSLCTMECPLRLTFIVTVAAFNKPVNQ